MKFARKIILSIMALIVTIICLTTTTYAWFNVYSSAEVEGFNLKVTGGQGFLVSIDDEHYDNDLTNEEIFNAILLSYGKEENPNNPTYQLRNGDLYLNDSGKLITLDEKKELIKAMRIKPRTTLDGINLMDLNNFELFRNNSPYDLSTQDDGSYIRFDVYFKATNNDIDANQTYNIYLLDEESQLENGEIIKPTTISSPIMNVRLIDDLRTYEQDYGTSVGLTSIIDVAPSNAMRFSIYDESKNLNYADIYELTTTGNLGSYATDYKIDELHSKGTNDEDALLVKLYDSYYNAGYTYYNNLKHGTLDPLKYEDMPNTIKDLTNESLPTVTTVKSGEEGKKVTFTFWLEGWDADCFDGIANNISVYLSFKSKRVNN